MRVTMLLADAAQEVNGKLYVLGGGWSVTGPDLPPMSIAIKLDVPWSAAGAPHQFTLELVDEDGRAVPAGDSGGVRVEGTFEVGRPVGLPAGSDIDFAFVVNDPAVPDQPRPLHVAAVHRRRHPRGLGAAVPGAGRASDRRASRLADVVAVLDGLYDPRWAEDWDAVGLVTGDPDQPVRRVLLAVDPVQAVIDEAVAWGADLLVTHHPLLLRGVHSVADHAPQGPRRDRARPGRCRAARRAHQRRRRRPGRLRRAGRRARPRPTCGPLQPVSRRTRSTRS